MEQGQILSKLIYMQLTRLDYVKIDHEQQLNASKIEY